MVLLGLPQLIGRRPPRAYDKGADVVVPAPGNSFLCVGYVESILVDIKRVEES